MGKFPSSWVTTFKRLVAISFAEEEIFYFWIVTCPHVTTRSEVMWHWWVSLNISLHGHKRCTREEISPFVCHMTSRDFVVRESCVWVSLIISDYPAKFGDYRPFGRGDIIFSICHVISRDRVVWGSCKILCEFFS